jgi:hypothetical protein
MSSDQSDRPSKACPTLDVLEATTVRREEFGLSGADIRNRKRYHDDRTGFDAAS